MTDEELAETRRIFAETQAELRRLQHPEKRRLVESAVSIYVFDVVPQLLAEVERQRRHEATLVEIIEGLANSYLTRDGIKRVFAEVDKVLSE